MEEKWTRTSDYPSLLWEIYHRLYDRFGPQHWWPAQTRFEVIIGAILTQSAAWTNVDKAIVNLKQANVLDPVSLREMPFQELARLVYPSGYFNAKAKKLKAFVEYLGRYYNDDLDSWFSKDTATLRAELLSIHGIGEETADSIILYAAHKSIFVVDAYTRRIFSRVGLVPEKDSYAGWQQIFEEHLPKEFRLFNEYHALLVALGKDICKKRPLCQKCCLLELCKYGSGTQEEMGSPIGATS